MDSLSEGHMQPDEMSDGTLIREIHKGNKVAAEKLFSRYQDALRKNVYFITGGNDHDVCDVCQETWLRFFDHVSKKLLILEHESVRNYIFKTAVNIVTDRGRKYVKHQRFITRHQKIVSNVELDPTEFVANNEEGKNVKRALSSLPKKQQTLIMEYYFSNRSLKEISLELEVSIGTIFNWKKQALESLYKILNAGGPKCY